MLTDTSKINGLPIRAEIRIPREYTDGTPGKWLSSVVVCQETDRHNTPVNSFAVWSIYQHTGRLEVENGVRDIADYGRALDIAHKRARTRV